MSKFKMSKEIKSGALLSAPSSLLLLALSMVPLLMLVIFSLIDGNIAHDGSIKGYTIDNLVNLFSDFVFWKLMVKSVWIGLAVTVICIILAYPVAWGIAKVTKPKNRNMMMLFIIIPFFTSQLLLIYSIMVLFQSQGILMTLLGKLHLADPSRSILYTNGAVLIILVYEYLPYMILSLYSSLAGIDDNVINASFSLGAGKWKTFTHVVFPMSIPGLLSGILLVLVPVTGSFVEPTLAGGPNGMMVGSLINSQFQIVLNMGKGAALSFMFLIVLSVIMAVLRLLINFANRRIGGLDEQTV